MEASINPSKSGPKGQIGRGQEEKERKKKGSEDREERKTSAAKGGGSIGSEEGAVGSGDDERAGDVFEGFVEKEGKDCSEMGA